MSKSNIANWHYDRYKKQDILDRALVHKTPFISKKEHERFSRVNQLSGGNSPEGVYARHWGELDDAVEELVALHYGFFLHK